MVGGAADAVDAAYPVLRVMGANIVHCGDAGAGGVAKICNNLVLGISMIGVSEAMNLGRKQGIDTTVLADVINTSTGRCWSSDTYNPCPGVMDGVPASRGYTGGFGSALMLKDLGLAVDAARSVGAPMPMGGVCQQLYQLQCAQGNGLKDFSSMYELFAGKDQ
jgi:3-hydroxyisobutyrate dehydrogenase